MDLAWRTDTDLGERFTKQALETDLNPPFILAFSGEINAGKSSLINAITGIDLCKVNVLPETSRLVRYAHGQTAQDLETAPLLQESQRPEPFLKNFHVIDSPGCNADLAGYETASSAGFEEADLIVFVFHVNNPWCASTWNQISELPKDHLQKICFVLQQVDRKQSQDLEIILEHMADLSTKRIATIPPMFPVSANLALEAKRSNPLDRRLHQQSGIPALESFISSRLCNSHERAQGLREWYTLSYQALRLIEDQMELQSRSHKDQNEFLNSLENEIDAMREGLVSRLPRHLTEVAEVFETEAVWVTKKLKTWLNLPLSLLRIFVGDQTGSRTENLFIERLRSAVELVAESDGKDVVTACQNHWVKLDARVKESIGSGIQNSEPIDEKLELARLRFVQRIGSAAHQAIGDLHVRKELEVELRKRNRALKSFTASGLFFLILAATFGFLEYHLIPWFLCSIAWLFFLGGAVIGILTKSGICKDFQSSLLNTCGTFAATLKSDYEEALRIFFQDYTSCLNSIRRHLASEKMAIEPRFKEWQGLFLNLKSAEQDL